MLNYTIQATIAFVKDGWHRTSQLPTFSVEAASPGEAMRKAQAVVDPCSIPGLTYTIDVNQEETGGYCHLATTLV